MPSVGLVSNVGEQRMLELVTNTSTGRENLVLHLFQNDITPASTMTLASYTEATFTGYAAVTLTTSDWAIMPGDPTTAVYSSGVAFTCSGTTSQAIYGFYLSQAGSSVLMWSERFVSAPYTITNVGDALSPRPALSVRYGLLGLEGGSGYIILEGSTGGIG